MQISKTSNSSVFSQMACAAEEASDGAGEDSPAGGKSINWDTNSSMVGVDSPMVERAARVWQLAGRAAQPRQVAA